MAARRMAARTSLTATAASFALAAALALPLLSLAGCGKVGASAPPGAPTTGTAVEAGAEPDRRPLQELLDYRLVETDRGVRRWVLASDRMQKFAGREELELLDVHMDFYRQGEHFSVLDADSGRVNPRTRAVHVWGAVDIVTDDGRRLQTEDLVYDDASGRITNDVFNRFTRGVDVLTGYGLDATPDLEYVEIRREVTAEVADPAPEGDGQP